MSKKSSYIVTIVLTDGSSMSFPYDNEDLAMSNAKAIHGAFFDDDDSPIASIIGAEVDYNLNIMEYFTTVN